MTIDRLDDDKKPDLINLDRIIRSLNDPNRSVRQAAFHQLSKLDDDAAKQASWNYLPYDRIECLHTIADFIDITDCGYGSNPNQLLDLPQYFGIADYSGQLVCYWSLTYKYAHLNCWNLITGAIQKSCRLSTHEFGLGQRGKIAIDTYQDRFTVQNLEDIGSYNKYSGITDVFSPTNLAFAVCPTNRTLIAIGGNRGGGNIEIGFINYETDIRYSYHEFKHHFFSPYVIYGSRYIGECRDIIRPLIFTPDGKTIVAHLYPHRLASILQIWDAETGESIQTLEGLFPFILKALAVRPDRTILACGLRNEKICVWELLSDRIIHATDEVGTCIMSPDGRIFAYGASTGDLVIWDLDLHREVCRLVGHTAPIGCITISEDREFIATYCTDLSIKIWGIPELVTE
jgi:WD40 repeat protein